MENEVIVVEEPSYGVHEVHLKSCKAAFRRKKNDPYSDPTLFLTSVPEKLMKSFNEYEGDAYKVHACAKTLFSKNYLKNVKEKS